MGDTSSPPTSIVYDLSKNPNKENVIYQEPSTAGSSLNDTNNSNKIQYQSQMESRNNAASTEPFVNLQLSQTSSIGKIETYKDWSILNIIFCSLCVGCVACWYSTETERFKKEGNLRDALKASERARTMNIVATLVGIILLGFYSTRLFS